MNLIKQLTELVGFHKSYIDHFGKEVFPSEEAQNALLSSMGFELDDVSIKNSIVSLKNKKWKEPLEPIYILSPKNINNKLLISLPTESNQVLEIRITLENKSIKTLTVNTDDLNIEDIQVLSDGSYTRYEIELPVLEEGYHRLTLNFDDQNHQCELVCVPSQCYSPKEAGAERVWGYAVQLYSLKNNKNWGLGNFSDLEEVVSSAANAGASVVGLNPLHALYYSNSAHISPYSPSSRSYLNVLYIDITKIDNYAHCSAIHKRINEKNFIEQLTQLEKNELIDYSHTASLKQEILELLFEDFFQHKETLYINSFQAFEKYLESEGENLHLYATYEALYEYFSLNFPNTYTWKKWSLEYQSPQSASVKTYQKANAKRILFYSFLQWIAHKQLSAVKDLTEAENMPIGLYLDLAVGCDGGGFDVWSEQSLYAKGASIGAPPDTMNNLGQDWGLTPINPVKLRESGYKALITALRSSMKYAGAIRIDHILGLMRQYWVAPGMKASEGIYISFPFEEILSIIALESKRNNCIVIGEDLGTVPEGFSEHMQSYGLLSYKIFFFERWWETGLFKRPEIYSDKAIVTASTHDLPTIKGWWMGRDLQWREKLSLYPTEELGIKDRSDRILDRERLISALQDFNLLTEDQTPSLSPPEINKALTIAVHEYLASTPSPIHLIPLEDALDIIEQVNIPGTIDEHPNWKQKLSIDVKAIWNDEGLKVIAARMKKIRSN